MATRKPKKVNYELIRRESAVGRGLYLMLDDLVDEFHEELRDARIALAWFGAWKPDVDGRLILGKARKASDLDRELIEFDFVIVLNFEFMTDQTVTIEQRRALLDHELCHCAQTLDADGEPLVDERGRKVWRLRRHDLEEFSEIVERHGCYKRDLEIFGKALAKARSKADATQFIGRRTLRERLLHLGWSVPLPVVFEWTEAQRREVHTWAVVQQELKAAGPGALMTEAAAPPMPACLQGVADPVPTAVSA